MKRSILLALLLVATAVSAQGSLYQTALPAFDYYTLSLSLAPAFCEEGPGRVRRSRQCNQLTDAEFRSHPLTLHGLWPSRLDRRHPAWCGKDHHEGGSFCRMDVVPLSSLTRQHLAEVMSGISDCLDRHEWAKHGTCTGLGADSYFSRAIELANRANRALGRQISSSIGNEIPLVQLRARLSQVDPQLTEATMFDCRSPRGGGRPMLSEIRIYFEKDPVTGAPGKPMPFRSAGVKNYNSGCPAGRAYIDRP